MAQTRKLKNEPQRANEVLKALPGTWRVTAGNRTFEVSTQNIRRDLGAWQQKPDSELLDRVVQHLETLLYEAAAYEAPAADAPSRHILLNNILARSEFNHVHGQTWMDRLKQRWTELLVRLLGRALSSSAIPTISDVVVYGLIVIAVFVLAYWMYRSVRDSASLETIMPAAMPVSAKEWPLWISEARAAAGRGDWREAIHLAYWGSISFLEMQGAWRPDVARTPREYLRLLPRESVHLPALRALTVRLETVWYGMQAADADVFQQTLTELERLGCPCN